MATFKKRISIGLDLSLVGTGVVIIKNGKIEKQTLIKTKPPTIKTPTTELERLEYIVSEIDDFTKGYIDNTIIVIEGLAMQMQRTTSLVQLSGLNYLVRQFAYCIDIPFVIVAPTQLKKFVSDKGNCAKELMLLETYKRYGISFSDNNLCDAHGLARIGEGIVDEKVKLTKYQKDITKKLKEQL